MHPEDRADSLRTDRHGRGFCDGCGEIPACCTCTEDDTPVGEVPPYLGRRGGVA